ncbi:hypothetical protein B0T26DRAFT_635442 [Lasiosphaeria miniovina]|uniref:Uncharacterized protein n=1 Tax=Lasiosphaeria miniovina TaxID=1954250 RepID=A0AA40BFW8_9PEZI|nr:uncharacterized protein B0T26DRAFT_635442 [Lasiosphaeria miniovina]KAK0733495.1 hypothetical protein B0T26DRAFT_635442 [Lasiosphaeria miniovina]
MASAVRQPSSSFHRSQSTPDLLSASTKSPPSAISSIDSSPRAFSLKFKTLPSLPAFDVPSFDLDDFELTLSGFGAEKAPPRRPPATETVVEIKAEAVAAATQAETVTRTRSMIDRPRSWLPSVKSSPNVRASQSPRPKRLSKDYVANAPETSSLEPKALERSRTIESFADFAKRSWISTSRSPSPPSKADRERGSDRMTGERNGASKSQSGPASQTVSGDRSGAKPEGDDGLAATESPSSKSRAFNRASIYLTRMKQKPQSVFSKGPSPAPLSASAARSCVSAADLNSTAPSALSATTNNALVTASTTAAPSPAPAPPRAIVTKLTTSTAPASNGSHSSIDSPRHSSSQTSSLDTTATTAASDDATPSSADRGASMPHPTSRDPLWATFRTLDVEFTKFAARNSTAARMGVVRSTLVPFLRSTAHHPSNSNRTILSLEDIDRRATILNKWWNGLLEMLDAGQSRLGVSLYGAAMGGGGILGQQPMMTTSLQPVAGVDRPTLLETTTMIMMRPEWRAITSYFQPLEQRSPVERVRARSSTQSTDDAPDSSANFLAESAEHNVRTMFVTNLLTQMALVVEKMSMRHAPLSLVNWCGKACAYAFFFVPGIADVLVRLWTVNGDVMRRVADEFGLPRRSKGESDDIVALFPPHLGKLGWTSGKTLGDKLRQAAKLPLLSARIPWHGPWISRWRGGDTDLFFIFCKYYYILADEFMPVGLPLVEKARAPAFVLLHAHLLSILDSTIHRQASIEAMLGPPLTDGLHGADTALMGLPLPSNLLKGMDENRMIILLKDMLSENSIGVAAGIKHTFAEAFLATAKAATKRTSRYEHAACFILCDFLEEVLVTLDAFQNTANSSIATSPSEEAFPAFDEVVSPSFDYIDWPFWFDVGKMIMNSNNTMSEIRIISFLYAVWDAITADPLRKEAICFGWLLTEEAFEKFFNHWCPMVRAYYMRLVCWRVCRDSGSPNELDAKIFILVSQRLKTVWSHFLWLQQTAEKEHRMPPSTAPCYPTPGKRFLIIRTEIPPVQPALLPGFDSFSSSFPGSDMISDFRGSVSANSNSSTASARTESISTVYKKKWSLLGRVLSLTATQANMGFGNVAIGGKRTWDDELEQARRETAASRAAAATTRSGPPPPPKQGAPSVVTPSSDSGSSTGSAPVFDAATFVFRFALTWQGQNGPGGGSPSRDRIITRPRLPAPAQSKVSARSAALLANGSIGGGSAIRNDSPPPISAGLPPPTRRISGVTQTGLVSEARNARPLSASLETETEKRVDKRLSLGVNVTAVHVVDKMAYDDDRLDIQSPIRLSGIDSDESERGRSFDMDSDVGRTQLASVSAVRPTGIYTSGAVYAGRALAEWGMVVSECNSFVDRRRDEGVLGLSDVEIPTLGVEGLGIRQRA